MAGLLDFFGNGWEDPKSNAVMALAGGLLDGDFASGLKGYSQVMAGAKDAQLKRAMQQAQMDNLTSEIEARKLAGVKDARQQALIESVFGKIKNNGTGVGEVPFPTGGMSTSMGNVNAQQGNIPMPEMPQSPRSQGSVLGNMRPDDVARLKLGGLDLTDIYKYANDPQKLEQGSTYKDRNTGLERFMPKVGEGMMPNQQGVYGFAPGYAEAQAKYEGDKASAIEAAKAPYSFQTHTFPGGGSALVSNAQLANAVNGNQPQSPSLAPRAAAGSEAQIIANGMGGLNGLPMTARGGDVSMKSTPAEMDKPRILQDAFAQVSADFNAAQKAGDSAGMRRAQSYLEEIRGEFARIDGRGQSTPQSLAPNTAPQSAPSFGLPLQSQQEKDRMAAVSDAYKAKLVDTAKADVVRDTAKTTEKKQYNQFSTGIDRAIDLLKQNPTASGLGAITDAGLGFVGQSTKSGDTANQLNALSGWLTANVPRMEGPQSNFDVDNYKLMAGAVGDRTKPISTRLAAAQEVKKLQEKYADINRGGEAKKQETKSLQEYGYKSNDDVLRDAKNTIMRNPQSKAEVERRLQSMGLSLGGR